MCVYMCVCVLKHAAEMGLRRDFIKRQCKRKCKREKTNIVLCNIITYVFENRDNELVRKGNRAIRP